MEDDGSRRQDPEGGEGQHQEQAFNMSRLPDVRGLPMKAVALQIAETGFLSETPGVKLGDGVREIADQTPGFSVAKFPDDADTAPLPTGFLEDLKPPRPVLTVSDQPSHWLGLTVGQ